MLLAGRRQKIWISCKKHPRYGNQYSNGSNHLLMHQHFAYDANYCADKHHNESPGRQSIRSLLFAFKVDCRRPFQIRLSGGLSKRLGNHLQACSTGAAKSLIRQCLQIAFGTIHLVPQYIRILKQDIRIEGLAREAAVSIKPGVERSETPGSRTTSDP